MSSRPPPNLAKSFTFYIAEIFLRFRVYDGGHHPTALPPAKLNTASERRWKVPRGGGSVDWSPPLPSFVPSPSRPDPLIPVRLRPRGGIVSIPLFLTSNSRRRPHPEKVLAAAFGVSGASSLLWRRSVELVRLSILISGSVSAALRFGFGFRVFDCDSDLVVRSPIRLIPMVLSVDFSAILNR
ncbi:hypothetical protein MUK42_36690 [Musa troglodytarum]|uniref:Uncharacterized protein n=1 Tax=Musa troglodytarum TaxID=320322 RepID=A0A9E7GC17_9LILI|nr:hypothetical protein MUK42_36690 [Musa troglodytarum]